MAKGYKASQGQLDLFLEEYARLGVIVRAAEAAGLKPNTIAKYRESDPKFEEAFEYAQQLYNGILETETYRRAVEGVDKPVFQKGGQVGVVREYSDVLLKMLMQANMPKYRDAQSKLEMAGPTGPVEIRFVDPVVVPPAGTTLPQAGSTATVEVRESAEDESPEADCN
jgi:hypothetical protein